MQPTMAHTLSKSLVELSTDEHKTTFVNVTQMLSSLIHTPRLKWLDNPSPLHLPQKLFSYSKHLLLPQYNHLLLPQHPKQAAAWSATAATHTPRKTTVTTDVQPPTGRTDVAPCWSGHVSKAPQCLLHRTRSHVIAIFMLNKCHPITWKLC